jgi:hypothetical protein
LILYDKKGTFLGMGQDELSMLGYEDMHDFVNNYSDFADLFIKRPGYISKFKNFFWIDYMLHSGTPNKNVVLKHKNGTEVESGLVVSELFLTQEINECTSLYGVELSAMSGTRSFKTDTISDFKTDTTPDFKTDIVSENLELQEETPLQEDDESGVENYISDTQDDLDTSVDFSKEISFGDENIADYPLPSDFKDEGEQSESDDLGDEQIHLKFPSDSKEETFDDNFKLKINLDEDFLSEDDDKTPELPEVNFDNIDEEAPLIRTGAPVFAQDTFQEDEVEAQNTDIKERETEALETIQPPDFQNVDFIQIAENTGMDLGDIATFISEFISESKEYLSNFEDFETLDMEFAKNEAMKLKSIAENLQMENISSTLDFIFQSPDSPTIIKHIKEYQMQIENLEEQLI